MSIVSSMVGLSTKTGWKRRSKAASFSMYLGTDFRWPPGDFHTVTHE
jgi:hypothetical protein